jgi:hypothetical protein
MGSNFLPALLAVILVFWIGFRLRNRSRQYEASDSE